MSEARTQARWIVESQAVLLTAGQSAMTGSNGGEKDLVENMWKTFMERCKCGGRRELAI